MPESLELRFMPETLETDLADAAGKITERLKYNPLPEAVIVSNNFSAILKNAAEKLNLEIPGDFSIWELCDVPSKRGLTEIRQPFAEMGREALRILFTNKEKAEKILIPGEIVFGKSIGIKDKNKERAYFHEISK